jgi:hypothetical protein
MGHPPSRGADARSGHVRCRGTPRRCTARSRVRPPISTSEPDRARSDTGAARGRFPDRPRPEVQCHDECSICFREADRRVGRAVLAVRFRLGAGAVGSLEDALALSGEMSEWSIEHAWKLTPAARADAHEIPPTHFRSTTSRNKDVHAHVPVNHGIDQGFGGHVTQF